MPRFTPRRFMASILAAWFVSGPSRAEACDCDPAVEEARVSADGSTRSCCVSVVDDEPIEGSVHSEARGRSQSAAELAPLRGITSTLG